MTLIITMLTNQRVIQASDRRLTWPNGSIHDDHANKAVCIICQDAYFSVAYTGIARIKGERTDRWLVDFLVSTQAPQVNVVDIARSLQERAQADLANVAAQQKFLSFVFAGYWNQLPFAFLISNFEDWETRQTDAARDQFSAKYVRPKGGVKHKFFGYIINGTEEAVTPSIEQCLKALRRSSLAHTTRSEDCSGDIAKVIVNLIRKASLTKGYGNRVGKNCMSVVVEPSGDTSFVTQYHPDKLSPQNYAPHLLTPKFMFKDIESSSDATIYLGG